MVLPRTLRPAMMANPFVVMDRQRVRSVALSRAAELQLRWHLMAQLTPEVSPTDHSHLCEADNPTHVPLKTVSNALQ